MVDRVSASITIGGRLPTDHLPEFLELIADEELSLEWDGEPFTAAQLACGLPLMLKGREVALGQFSRLEDFCVARNLQFRRWCAGCYSWGPQRAVFDGTGEVSYYATDDEDEALLSLTLAADLGSFEAILAWFEAANLTVPPLAIGDNIWRSACEAVHCLISVSSLVPTRELEAEDRALLPFYAVALSDDRGACADHKAIIEAAKNVFHQTIAIGNLDHFVIEVEIAARRGDIPADALWLDGAASILPRLTSP
ncbi:hypothetical protein [Novosphingobium sp.]|uniref:hypothetical protein n=1 Tax=Novosphingobium sp. TaxID=1874826 RepID=UPI0031E3D640